MKKIFIAAAICISAKTMAQTEQQWAQKVNWDGVSYFDKYIIYNAAHLGPNALTVPFLSTGSIDSVNAIGVTGQLHFAKGDHTQNLNIYGNYCLVKNKISFDVAWIPVEFFNMSDSIKYQRNVYYKNYYDKQAKGDVILNTNINLLNQIRNKVQLAMRIGVRLPSSSSRGVAAARFVDATCYYVDFSCGKALSPNLKWMTMAGLFVWQQDKKDLRQNDAFLFGSGLQWNKNNWKVESNISGYLGYMEKSGDKPIVFRLGAEKKLGNVNALFRFQQGIQNYKYTSWEMGVKRTF